MILYHGAHNLSVSIEVSYILFLLTSQLDHAPDGKFDIHSVIISTYFFADRWRKCKRHTFSGKWAPVFVSFP